MQHRRERGQDIRDEAKFNSMDYALMCSSTHPDAPGPELNLLTDWNVWIFFFDDRFVETYKRTRNQAEAKQHLARLPLFMPLEATTAPPDPTNAVESGLADLWSPRRIAFDEESRRSRRHRKTPSARPQLSTNVGSRRSLGGLRG